MSQEESLNRFSYFLKSGFHLYLSSFVKLNTTQGSTPFFRLLSVTSSLPFVTDIEKLCKCSVVRTCFDYIMLLFFNIGGRTIFSSLKSLTYYLKQVFYPSTFLTPNIGGRNSIFDEFQNPVLSRIYFFVYICKWNKILWVLV